MCRSVCLTLAASLLATSVWSRASAENRGRPWKHHSIDATARGADGVRLADANGDGLPDIVTGWEEAGLIRMYLHPGPAKAKAAWPAVTVGRVKSPEDAVLVDLDGDGALDVVSCCEGSTRSVFVHWGPQVAGALRVPSPDAGTRSVPATLLDESAWKTEAFPALAGHMMAMYCLPLEIDGAEGIDLVVGGKGNGAEIGWLQSPENPRDLAAWKWHPMTPAGWIMSLMAADIDGDGDVDIVVSDRKGKDAGCVWLENPGSGKAQERPWTRHPIGATKQEVMFLDYAALDGDVPGVLVPTYDKRLFWLSRTQLSPPLWTEKELAYPDGVGRGKGARIADIDLDGRLDIVLSTENYEGTSGLVWLAREGDGWRTHEISGPAGLRGMKLDDVVLVDLDADGDLDVLTTEERTGLGVVWFENPTR